MSFLGHKFEPNGIELNQTKIDAILEMEEPQNKHELRSFIGMVNYPRRFILN